MLLKLLNRDKLPVTMKLTTDTLDIFNTFLKLGIYTCI